ELPDLVRRDVERHQLIRRLDPFVEVDRLAVLRPEADRHRAVETTAELLELAALVAHVARVDAQVVAHDEIIWCRERDSSGIRREAERALTDLLVVREAFCLATRH